MSYGIVSFVPGDDTCIVALVTVQSVGAQMKQSPASSFRRGSGPEQEMTFLCPINPEIASAMRSKLRQVELRPTRPRVALSALLFAKGDRHVTAEMLFEEANQAKVSVSLATVYNTLHQFTRLVCCARSLSTARRPISTSTIPSTIISTSRIVTS